MAISTMATLPARRERRRKVGRSVPAGIPSGGVITIAAMA
jgi:hypothetical protein